MKRLGDLEPHWNAAPWQGQHNHIRPTFIRMKLSGQSTTRVASILKAHSHVALARQTPCRTELGGADARGWSAD
jgi:hypothetical protein